MALGSWIWGTVAEASDLRTAFVVAAAAVACATVLGWRWPLRQHGTDNLDPLARLTEPDLRLEISPRSGPIAIVIEYDIAEEDLAAFLEVMAERRRIRIRDGARHWVLQRDLEHPDRWQESYRVPTWVDYVRHIERRTQADFGVTERLRALHRGEGGFRIHRLIERPVAHDVGHLRRIDPDDTDH
jgi:hypothetical protein